MTQLIDLGKIRFNFLGEWSAGTTYENNDVVKHGGSLYVYANPVPASSNLPTNTVYWKPMADGIRWRGNWASSQSYIAGDVIRSPLGAAYIVKEDYVSSGSFDTDLTDLKIEVFATGGAEAFPATVGKEGYSLTVSGDGTNFDWINATGSDKVYYVTPGGSDSNSGTSLSAPFASIKYACEQAGDDATIFVRTGSYTEDLPIVVGSNTAVVGDNQRTVSVHAAAGFENGTMWKLSNGAILNKMTFKGMTGWVPGSTADDITTSTPAGIAVAFNELSPVSTKSPYVLECSFIGSGGIGAYVDGTLHGSGNKSMIFHGYTIISDNGVGYWVNNGGLAELVSNFTYYCYFGYTCTNGSEIRSLNGNCSYGTYGASSSGFDASEVPLTGTLVGEELNAVYVSGTVNVGDTITDDITGATAEILNVQYSADKVYIKSRSGTFGAGNNCTTSGGAIFTATVDAVRDVRGFILIVSGLAAEPRPGGSISLADDSISYVIQSVSGTYVDTSSNMIIVLSQEKPTGSVNGTGATVRYNYSQVRLTGHDFLQIGTGGVVTTNHPNEPTQPPAQGNEIQETFPGRVYYVSTDQNGNFRVGEFFKIDQATGTATLNASAFNLAGLTSLRLGSIGAQLGESINEFSSDATMVGNSNLAVPTEAAVKTYVDSKASEALTLTNKTLSDSLLSGDIKEKALVTGLQAGGTVDIDASTQQVVYYTGDSIANFTLNVRGDSSNTLDSLMNVGDVITLAFIITNGGTAYYNNAFQIDGISVTPKWLGGAPTGGTASSVEAYSYTIIKTALATFTVLASITAFE